MLGGGGKGKTGATKGERERRQTQKGKGKRGWTTILENSHLTTTARARTNKTERFPGWSHPQPPVSTKNSQKHENDFYGSNICKN